MSKSYIEYIQHYFLEILIISIALIHQLLQKILGINIHYWDFYGDDLLAVPFVSAIVLIIENTFFYKNPYRRHSFMQLSFILIVLILLFEFILPNQSNRYVQDYLDILFYTLGTLMYYFAKTWYNKKRLQKL